MSEEVTLTEKIKVVVKYILLPVTLLFGFIFYLLQRVSNLKSEVSRKESEAKLADTLNKVERAKETADEKEQEFNNDYSDYQRVRDEHDDGGGLSN